LNGMLGVRIILIGQEIGVIPPPSLVQGRWGILRINLKNLIQGGMMS